jgi:acyl-coenzyme A synthetase/AMP-(fatty) acid ligase
MGLADRDRNVPITHPSVQEAAVVGISIMGRPARAVIVLALDHGESDAGALQDWCKSGCSGARFA